MRREYLSGTSGTGGGGDIPFEENLVFYAPLTQGDLTDHISGTTGTIDSGCTVTWDSTRSMYHLVVSNQRYPTAAITWTGLSMSIGANPNQKYTYFGQFEYVSISGNGYACYITVSSYKTSGQTTSRWSNGDIAEYLGYSSGTNWNPGAGVHKMSCVMDSTAGDKKYNRYLDGSQITLKTNWTGYNGAPTAVSLAQLLNNNYAFNIYAKDIRVYNRALTESEIAQL